MAGRTVKDILATSALAASLAASAAVPEVSAQTPRQLRQQAQQARRNHTPRERAEALLEIQYIAFEMLESQDAITQSRRQRRYSNEPGYSSAPPRADDQNKVPETRRIKKPSERERLGWGILADLTRNRTARRRADQIERQAEEARRDENKRVHDERNEATVQRRRDQARVHETERRIARDAGRDFRIDEREYEEVIRDANSELLRMVKDGEITSGDLRIIRDQVKARGDAEQGPRSEAQEQEFHRVGETLFAAVAQLPETPGTERHVQIARHDGGKNASVLEKTPEGGFRAILRPGRDAAAAQDAREQAAQAKAQNREFVARLHQGPKDRGLKRG